MDDRALNEAMAPPNVVITGAWRSGTTLLFLLFPPSFQDVVTPDGETAALETLLPCSSSWRLSKRPNDIHVAREIHAQFDPRIIYMLRDPRDCIVSWRLDREGYWMGFNEWLRNYLFSLAANQSRLATVRYEDLVSVPDEVQKDLIERIPGLILREPFSTAWQRINSDSPVSHQLVRSTGPTRQGPAIREIETTGIGAWRSDVPRVVEQLNAFPEMQAVLEICGYEADAQWQEELIHV